MKRYSMNRFIQKIYLWIALYVILKAIKMSKHIDCAVTGELDLVPDILDGCINIDK